jgi:hypothetical protein
MSSIVMPARETTQKPWMLWTGRVLSLFPIFIVLLSASWKLSRNPWYVAEFGRIGWPTTVLTGLALIQLTGIVLFVIPRTALLGAVLLTGYLGGAIATYVRIGEFYPASLPFSTSVMAWAGLYLRDERLRSMLPLRRDR